MEKGAVSRNMSTSPRAPALLTFPCGIELMDLLHPILTEIAAPILTKFDSQVILKGLMMYACDTPVATVGNLFQGCQVSDVDVNNIDCAAQVKHRNWQWILQAAIPIHWGDTIQEKAWRKSKAVEIERLITKGLSSEEDEQVKDGAGVRFIVGYWIHKLYEARFMDIKPEAVPRCVTRAYHGFLKWKGPEWKNYKINPDVVESLYNNWSRIKEDRNNPALLMSEFWSDGYGLMKTEEAELSWNGITANQLSLFLRCSFDGTLQEFRSFFGIKIDTKKPLVAMCKTSEERPTAKPLVAKLESNERTPTRDQSEVKYEDNGCRATKRSMKNDASLKTPFQESRSPADDPGAAQQCMKANPPVKMTFKRTRSNDGSQWKIVGHQGAERQDIEAPLKNRKTDYILSKHEKKESVGINGPDNSSLPLKKRPLERMPALEIAEEENPLKNRLKEPMSNYQKSCTIVRDEGVNPIQEAIVYVIRSTPIPNSH